MEMLYQSRCEPTLTLASLQALSTVTNDCGAGLPRLTNNLVSRRELRIGIFQVRSHVERLQAKTV